VGIVATRRSAPPARPRPIQRRAQPRRPVPPSELTLATVEDHDLEPESTFKALGFFDIDLSRRTAHSVEFEQCRFRAATLAGCQLTKVRITDCLVENSDWSNLHGDAGTIERAKLSDSRMTGLAWADGLLRDVTFQQCKLDLTNWRMASFDAAFFVDCNLSRADFTDADLRGACFTRCNLTGAQFSKASMQGARFRGCELGSIGGITSWDGAVVHHDDLLALSYALAGALGIVVEGGDD
jgi:uncharacterized protein YjbI with pentapeptide repeats